MAKKPDFDGMRTVIAARLEPGEDIDGLFTALMPEPDSGDGGSTFALGGLLIMAYQFTAWRYTAHRAGKKAGVPLAPRMIIAITPRRLAIWTASYGWRIGRHLGDLPRDRVVGVTATGAGSHSRSLSLSLVSGATITMRVAPSVAGSLGAKLGFQSA